MGRPLNKKYFGNRNFGRAGDQTAGPNSNSQNYADDNIGGEGIASINWSNYGSWRAVTAGQPPLAGLQLPAPTIPGGVQATWTNYFGAASVSTGAGHSGLVAGETYTYAPIPGLLITVATVPGVGNATFTVTTPGSTTTLLQDLEGVSITKSPGMTGAATFSVDINLKIVNTVINEKGSGYTGEETIDVQLANSATGQVPVGTIVLTTDSGVVGSSTNQENAIIIHANTGNEGDQIGDIIRQVSTRRYKVKTADGIRICELTDDDTPGVGYAYIKATDDNGNTYFVMKLTSKLAVLKHWNNNESTWLFQDNERAHWVFSDTENSYSPADTVVIENA